MEGRKSARAGDDAITQRSQVSTKLGRCVGEDEREDDKRKEEKMVMQLTHLAQGFVTQ